MKIRAVTFPIRVGSTAEGGPAQFARVDACNVGGFTSRS